MSKESTPIIKIPPKDEEELQVLPGIISDKEVIEATTTTPAEHEKKRLLLDEEARKFDEKMEALFKKIGVK